MLLFHYTDAKTPEQKVKETVKSKPPKPVQQNRKSDKLKVPPEVLRIATDRHMNGYMHPWVHQMLTKVCEHYLAMVMKHEGTEWHKNHNLHSIGL